MKLNSEITEIKGIGDKTAKILKKLNINIFEDLIYYFPRTYEGKNEFVKIESISAEGEYMVDVTVIDTPITIRKNNKIITKIKTGDGTGILTLIWFNQGYMAKNFSINQKILLKGKISILKAAKQMVSPRILKESDYILNTQQELFPVYPLTKGISNRQFSEWINEVLVNCRDELIDFLPKKLVNEYDLLDFATSINEIHNPINNKALFHARRRLIFNEFLLFQLGLLSLKKESEIIKNPFIFNKSVIAEKFMKNLSFELTNAQKRVLEEMKKDIVSNRTMNRLIQGDVGSGKTIIAVLALILAVENGYQGTLMAPTEVLAKQHYESISRQLEAYNIRLGLLIGSMTKKEKNEIKKLLLNGEIQILIGTHAIIQDSVDFKNLAMVITDEQHRFGVKQRESLTEKGNCPHVLVMSATPIPRTLALIIYGDMDISIIDELPPGRQNIKTYIVDSGYRERIFTFIEKEIRQGRQIYVVCPAIEENEDLEIEAVGNYMIKAKEYFDESTRISALHGKMKAKEKNSIMDLFSKGEIDILISTTVIEVGINVPNATIMVIENAERFGLAGLHQLRGRVGRGSHQSYCILITDTKSKDTKKRMKVLEESNDGFKIAEHDLKQRGPGDPLGIKQHGLPEFRIGNVIDNIDILKETNELAKKIIDSSIDIGNEEYRELLIKANGINRITIL